MLRPLCSPFSITNLALSKIESGSKVQDKVRSGRRRQMGQGMVS